MCVCFECVAIFMFDSHLSMYTGFVLCLTAVVVRAFGVNMGAKSVAIHRQSQPLDNFNAIEMQDFFVVIFILA